MRKIVATVAPEFRTNTVRNIAWIYAVVLTVMAVGQLFAFEKFIPLLQDYRLPGGYGTAALVACVTVVVEVFALPFLLRMSLSPLMRAVSKSFGVIAPAIWLILAIHAYLANVIPSNGGMLGAEVTVAVSLQLLLSLVCGGVAVWTVSNTVQKNRK